jgi:hypothetical protein
MSDTIRRKNLKNQFEGWTKEEAAHRGVLPERLAARWNRCNNKSFNHDRYHGYDEKIETSQLKKLRKKISLKKIEENMEIEQENFFDCDLFNYDLIDPNSFEDGTEHDYFDCDLFDYDLFDCDYCSDEQEYDEQEYLDVAELCGTQTF